MKTDQKSAKLTYAFIVAGVVLLILGLYLVLTSNKTSTGIITSASSDTVEIQKADGTTETFVNKATDVSVEHLHEHERSEEPVKVKWENQNGQKTAVSIGDE